MLATFLLHSLNCCRTRRVLSLWLYGLYKQLHRGSEGQYFFADGLQQWQIESLNWSLSFFLSRSPFFSRSLLLPDLKLCVG